MNELEKILEEIDSEIEKERAICENIENTPGFRLYEKTMKMAKDIIRNHMNAGWISARKESPETGKRCLVKMKHHSWISDYDSEYIPDCEKVYHAEYIEVCEAIYQEDGEWIYIDTDIEATTTAFTNPYPTLSAPLDEVIEWKYMYSLQPEFCKYTGGSCCWPIDQCEDCPNHPRGTSGLQKM